MSSVPAPSANAEPLANTTSQSMITAVVLCAYASSLIIMSGIGIRAMDLVAITMVEKFKKQF